ncbi:MAG: glycosyl transferase family 1 [Caulobacterales bacterium 32-69-10]|nr:MAG: glycosyl transferase family 1 [Caulobacterales bacterium 32-69-10]
MAFDAFAPHPAPGRPLRVALFSGNYNYTVDGANKALNRLVQHLEDVEGARVRVYSPTAPVAAFAPRGELVSAPSFQIPGRPDYRMAMGLSPAIRRDVAAFAPDIVHVSAPDLLGAGAVKLARRMGVPAVASLHTLFETYLDYYGLGWLRPAVEQRLRAFYASCDYVLAPTPAIAARLRAEGLGDRMRVWARGVDRELFDPARRDMAWRRAQGFDDARPVIVSFGRLVMEKGLATFADTIDAIEAASGPVQVLVVGDGPARPWMEQRLPRAVFTGFLSGEALASAIAAGDILLNPSKTETFGNVTLEAMAAGLAPVCADAPNNRFLLTHGRTGLICPADDAAAYAQAIRGLIDTPAALQGLQAAARAESAAYSWSRILDAVVGVYREATAIDTVQARAA